MGDARSAAAITYAHLLGTYTTTDNPSLGRRHAFARDVEMARYFFEHSVEQAAWMFLVRLHLGISNDGRCELVDLRTQRAPTTL